MSIPVSDAPLINPFPVIIVTGLSGSGKSTALSVFEDMGFFAVDGLPAILAPQMVSMLAEAKLSDYKGVVLGMDVRQSAFMRDYERALIVMQTQGFIPQILFLETKTDILVKRYATTRRPHPLEKEGLGLEQAMDMERKRLEPLRTLADLVLDTTGFSIHDLRRTLQAHWKAPRPLTRALRIHIVSFGFKYGTPAEADMMFDLRFLPNPYFIPHLKPLSGQDASVADYVLATNPGKEFFERLSDFLLYVLQQYEAEGRFRLTIAIGCTGGRHRSVATAETLLKTLQKHEYSPTLEHRHLDLG